jgi:streptogramin lyase
MKRRIAKLAVSGALVLGGVAMPLALAAQPAHAAPSGSWVNTGGECTIIFHPALTGTVYFNTQNGRILCFFG